MPYLTKAVGLYERSVINDCVGMKVGEALIGSPVRVLDAVVPITPTDNRIPGGNDPILALSADRLSWLRENALDLIQVASDEGVAIGFALVPRHYLSSLPIEIKDVDQCQIST